MQVLFMLRVQRTVLLSSVAPGYAARRALIVPALTATARAKRTLRDVPLGSWVGVGVKCQA